MLVKCTIGLVALKQCKGHGHGRAVILLVACQKALDARDIPRRDGSRCVHPE